MDSTITVSDEDLITSLYAQHYRSLIRLAALLLDEVAACEDVVQEAYIRVHNARGRLRDPDKALAYLRQTVVNLSRSTLRRRLVAARHAPGRCRTRRARSTTRTRSSSAMPWWLPCDNCRAANGRRWCFATTPTRPRRRPPL